MSGAICSLCTGCTSEKKVGGASWEAARKGRTLAGGKGKYALNTEDASPLATADTENIHRGGNIKD